MHSAIAERLAREPELIEHAGARVETWARGRQMHPRYADAWREILERPVEEVARVLTDPGERATALRQSTPFAGALDSKTRWKIWREVGERYAREGGG